MVYTDGAGIDVALPRDVPVVVLLPALHDLLTGLGPRGAGTGVLSRPGWGPLDPEKTLDDNDVDDGSVLTIEPVGVLRRAPTLIDPAVAVAASAAPHALGCPLTVRRAGAVVATVMAALTGVLMVPGGPGLPDVLLATAAAAVTAVLSVRVVGDPAGVGSATAWFASMCTAVALAGTLTGLTVGTSAVALIVFSLMSLTSAARLTVRMSALRPSRLHQRMTAVTAGAAAGAAAGVVAVAGAQPGWASGGLGAVVSGILVLRVRACRQGTSVVALVGGALLCAAAALLSVGYQAPLASGLIAVALSAGGLLLAMSSGRIAPSPATDRALGFVEFGLLVAVAPLCCWTAGAFDGVLP